MSSEEKLKEKLLSFKDKQFTGRLDINDSKGQQWRLYFCLSRFIWADSSCLMNRTWQRLLSYYCPKVDETQIDIQEAQKLECWDYHIISVLLEKFRISKEQATQLIEAKINEVLFDILQAESKEILEYNFVPIEASLLSTYGLKVSLTLLRIEPIIRDIENEWIIWSQQGLGGFSPNFAPLIKNPALLQKQFSPETYQRLYLLLNGKITLRELAIKVNQELLTFTLWLKPYIEKGLIDLVEVRDIPLRSTIYQRTTLITQNTKITKTTSSRLVVCIDDSQQICSIMEHIVHKTGCQFLAIQDPLKALPQLLKTTPDLIFLDLIMPIVNGYEICSQIRRVSKLKDVPIVILTSNDGVIDRVRSKIVGASAFLGKPINEEKVVEKINYFFDLSQKHKQKQGLPNQVKLQTQIVA
jgi:CheY-like chemotaxis protein